MKNSVAFVFSATCLLSANSFASGLEDLKAALDNLKGTTPIQAQFHQKVTESNGEDDELKLESGEVQVFLFDHENGLQVTYSNAVLASLEQESMRKASDETSETPITMAVNSIATTELRSMLSATTNIKRRLNQAIFVAETAIEQEGKQLRQLEFTMPLESIIDDERTRKYVKKFESSYRILIDEAGIPLESQLSFHGKGRAYVVLRVEAMGEGTARYEVVGDRLVCVHSEYRNGWDSTFGEGEFTELQDLTVLPASNVASSGFSPSDVKTAIGGDMAPSQSSH